MRDKRKVRFAFLDVGFLPRRFGGILGGILGAPLDNSLDASLGDTLGHQQDGFAANHGEARHPTRGSSALVSFAPFHVPRFT